MHPRIQELQHSPLLLNTPQVLYAPGDRFSKNSGRWRIGFTMHEADHLPASWVEQANQMDAIWTPSAWGREVFLHSGITRPIQVVPLGFDPARYHPGPARQHLRDRTIFLSVFEWGRRKGWDTLLKAYCAAFGPHDPVLLVLKIDSRAPGNPLGELAAVLPANPPPIGLIYNQSFSAERMAELYRAADCFVLPSRGEGWGMPLLEAMACGTPVIATNWSAPTTFLREEQSYLLPYRLVPADQHNRYTRGAQWAEPDAAILVDQLRWVAAHPQERVEKGRQAAIYALSWTWDRAVEIALEQLTSLL
jgi:glycosyltransferase involved in cell wall biosynthesis